MKKIAIFTTSRAEFNLILPLIEEMRRSKFLKPLLFVGGAHIKSYREQTMRELQNRKIPMADSFDFLLSENDKYSLGKSIGIASFELSRIFYSYKFDIICVVGDRFEILSILNIAILFGVPIIHIFGGESSQGTLDEQVRHMATKAAHIHFVSCDEYAQNVRRMGEQDSRIFTVGALGVDAIVNRDKKDKKQIFGELGLDTDQKTILMTYHPATHEISISPKKQVENIFKALSSTNFQIVVTSPGVEVGQQEILETILYISEKQNNIIYIETLGSNYYHLLEYCEFAIGNSSSGIIEVPFFKIPTINIGSRQDGRIRHESIIDTDISLESIAEGIKKAQSSKLRKKIRNNMKFKFGDGRAAERIVKVLSETKIDQKLMIKKLDFPKKNG